MGELVFLKLGGSLITDKRRFETAREDVIARIAEEIHAALDARPEMQLLLGHGSGSFGHFVADRYKVQEGNLEDWRGYAETSAAAQQLNRLVTDALLLAGVDVVSLQPSASALCHDGALHHLDIDVAASLLRQGLVPMVYGDVALDDVKGCTIISTEQIFDYLARSLCPARIIVAGEVAGVFSGDPQQDAIVQLVPEINRRNYEDVKEMLSNSLTVDVTGGMFSKVETLFALACDQPNLQIRIVTGKREGLLQRVLCNPDLAEGTLLRY